MPTHPSSPFSHAHTRTHHQPDSSHPGLAQWACYKGLSVWVQSRLDPCPNDTYIHTIEEPGCDCCCCWWWCDSGVSSTVPRVAMLASRLHASSLHDVTAASQPPRQAASTRRHSVLPTKKEVGPVRDCKSDFDPRQTDVCRMKLQASASSLKFNFVVKETREQLQNGPLCHGQLRPVLFLNKCLFDS